MATDLSVIIPALDEGDRIGALVAHCRAAACGGAVEVVVVDGDPAGSTLARIDDRAVVRLTAPRGRARQMNEGARAAAGEALVFCHADTWLPRGYDLLVRNTLGAGARAGAFSLAFDSARPGLRLIAAMANLRSRIAGLPFGDQALFLSRRYFETLGGFAEIPLMEDVELARRIARAGGRIVILDERVTTAARRWERDGLCFTTLRNWSLQVRYLLGADPARLAAVYERARRRNGR